MGRYFIRAGETLNLEIPIGKYEIKYAYGNNWYGDQKLFGVNTKYAKADQVLDFNFNGYEYSGYTIELIQQINGNLTTSNINESQF